MNEIRTALIVDGVWRLPNSKMVVVSASGGAEYSITWHCQPANAPRVGESVAVRIVDAPPDKSLNQALGL